MLRLSFHSSSGLPAAETPIGSVRVTAEEWVSASAREVIRLTLDLPRFAVGEPRLKAAYWIRDEPPRPGSRAQIVVELPESMRSLEHLFGEPSVVATLESTVMGETIDYSIVGRGLTGTFCITCRATASGTVVRLSGHVRPTSPIARVLVAPITVYLEERGSRAASRVIRRAAARLSAAAERERRSVGLSVDASDQGR